MRLTLRARGPAAPSAAWRRYADLDAWSAWSPQIAAVVTDDGSRALAAGLSGAVTGAVVASRPLLRVRFTVLAVDAPAMAWSWRVRATRVVVDVPPRLQPLVTLHLHHRVSAEVGPGTGPRTGPRPGPGAASTLTSLRTSGPAPVVLGYALPALVALRRLVR